MNEDKVFVPQLSNLLLPVQHVLAVLEPGIGETDMYPVCRATTWLRWQCNSGDRHSFPVLHRLPCRQAVSLLPHVGSTTHCGGQCP